MKPARYWLDQANEAMQAAKEIVTDGRPAFDMDVHRQRSLTYVLVALGSALREYAKVSDGRGSVFEDIIKMRDLLAHIALSRVDPTTVWYTAAKDLPDVQVHIDALLSYMAGNP